MSAQLALLATARTILHNRNNESLFLYDISSGDYWCSTTAEDITIAFDNHCVVIANSGSNEMLVDRWGGTEFVMESDKETLDLDASGRRWEGGVRIGKPNGYGTLYDEEGRKEYEGFMLDGMKTCYGIEYYSDIMSKRYEGGYNKDERLGKGVLYDRNGSVEWEGLWWKDQLYSSSCNGSVIDNHMESVNVPNHSFSSVESLRLVSWLYSLKQIVIGDDCFGAVRFFELDGLCELESVVIGKKSFTIVNKDLYREGDYESNDGVFRVVNCPRLWILRTGNHSFSDYRSFEMSNLPSLTQLDLGMYSFVFGTKMVLKGMVYCRVE